MYLRTSTSILATICAIVLSAYQKAVLTALEDFEDACVGYSTQEARLADVLEQAQRIRFA